MKKLFKIVAVFLCMLMFSSTVLAADITIINMNGEYSYQIDGVIYNADDAKVKLKGLGYTDEQIKSIIVEKEELTFDNQDVLDLLDAYDSEGAFIIRDALADGENIFRWWKQNNIISALETAIHEECHHNTHSNAGGLLGKESIYIGNGNSILINYDWYNGLYKTEEMADRLDESLRTTRYDTYVAKSDNTQNIGANINGIYGLLNEFQAYCWGMNNIVSMLPYYENKCFTKDDASAYLTGSSTAGAYYEFNFWILSYMLYAKENYPEIYDSVLNNKEFIDAYIAIDDKYESLIGKYYEGLDVLVGYYKKNGVTAQIKTGSFFVYDSEGRGMGIVVDNEDISILKTELAKPEYQQMYNILKNGVNSDYEHLSDVNNDLTYEVELNLNIQLMKGLEQNSTVSDLRLKFENADIEALDSNGNIMTDDLTVGTGCTIQLLSNNNVVDSAVVFIYGDADGSGVIDVLDMEAIQKSILGIGYGLTGVYKQAALLTGGNELTVLDMEAIQKDILGIQKIN